MKKITLIFCILIFCGFSKAQDTTVFHSVMDDFNRCYGAALASESDSLKIKNVLSAADILETALKEDGVFGYNFYKIKNLSSVVSSDGRVRVLTFGIALNSGRYAYHGFILYSNGKTVRTTRLKEADKEGLDLSHADMQSGNWFGAVYYEINRFGDSKHPVYALCGWDGADMFVNRKVLEQVIFTPSGTPRFGGKFQDETSDNNTRLVFTYTEKAAMSLSYNKKMKAIVGDHLNAMPQFKGNPRFYGPDMTFDGFYYDSGKWYYLEDVDVKLK